MAFLKLYQVDTQKINLWINLQIIRKISTLTIQNIYMICSRKKR